MLYVVSTPIGNLKDITQRALEILKSVDIIFGESPTDSMRLLNAYEIKGKKIYKYNDRNKKGVEKNIVEILQEKEVAYISSAGTPGISDPGEDLVKIARENDIKVNVIPGASALVSAIAGSGLRSREFTFVSFPPKKSGQLKNLFKKYQELETTLVFFESPYRVVKTLEGLNEVCPDSRVCVAKEMTKMFENYFVGNPEQVLSEIAKSPKNLRGEFVIVVQF